MKLIEALVQELPRRGGWPEGVEEIWQDYDRLMRPLGWFHDELCDDHRRQHHDADVKINRRQYEAALAARKTEWDGEGLPPGGVEFEHSFHADGFSTWHRRRCTAVGKHGVLCVDEKDAELYLNDTNNRFRPIRSEADKKKQETIFAIAELCRGSASNGHSAELIYDAIKSGKIVID